MPKRSRKTLQRRKRLRRCHNKQARANLLTNIKGGGACARTVFSGQVRKGDAVPVSFEFSGIRVPYDPTSDTSGKDIQERTELIIKAATMGDV